MIEKRLRIQFLHNGGTSVHEYGHDGKGKTVSPLEALNEPWILTYARWLEFKGVDPTQVRDIFMPDGLFAKFSRLPTGELGFETTGLAGWVIENLTNAEKKARG